MKKTPEVIKPPREFFFQSRKEIFYKFVGEKGACIKLLLIMKRFFVLFVMILQTVS